MTIARIFANRWIPLCVVWVAGLIAYSNCYQGQFVLDDVTAITQNKSLAHLTLETTNWRPLARPLTTWSFAGQWTPGTLDPRPFHVVNVALHLCAATAAYGLLLTLITHSAFAARWSIPKEWIAGAVAAIWVAHPLTTEAVTYLVQRAEVLAALGMVACCWCYVQGALSSQRYGIWYCLAVLLAVMATLSKPTAVVLPVLLLSCELATPARSPRLTRWLMLGGLMLPAAWIVWDTAIEGLIVAPVAEVGAPASAAAPASAGVGTAGLTRWEYLRSQPGVVSYYVWLAVSLQSQSLDHGWKVADDILEIAGPVLGWSLFFGGLIVWWFSIRRCPATGAASCSLRQICLPGFALLLTSWFLCLLAPTSSLVPIRDLAVEHRMYLPLFCLIALLVLFWTILVDWCTSRPAWQRGLWLSGVSLVTVICLWQTQVRNRDYHNLERLWQRAVISCPENPRVQTYYAAALLQRGEYPAAASELVSAIFRYESDVRKPLPDDRELASAYSLLGVAFGETQRLDDAAKLLQQAVNLAPESAEIATNLGAIRQRQEQFEEAERWYRRALELEPGHLRAWLNLGRLQRSQGDLAAAISTLSQGFELHPDSLDMGISLAASYEQADQLDAAEQVYLRLQTRTALDPATWLAWGKLSRRRGEYAAAYDKFVQAAQLSPDDPWPVVLQAEMLARLGKTEAADDLVVRVLQRVSPDSDVARDLQRLRSALRP